MMALQGHVADFAVFGDDYDTPDGTAIRDYIHVTDLAAAHVLALKLLMQGHCGGALNLGTGTGFSVREILGAIAAETGRKVPHVVKPRRPGDPTYLVADATAARKVLKFHPSHSDLATIIRTAWAWHQVAHPLKAAETGEERAPRHVASAPGLAALEQASNSDHESTGLHAPGDVP
jgi:UDP-glucose 4-epimerase